MKKRKSSFGLFALLVPLVGAVIVFNAKSHAAEDKNAPPPVPKEQPTSVSSDQLLNKVKGTSNAPASNPHAPKMPGGGPPGRESMVVDPRHARGPNGKLNPVYGGGPPKPDLVNSTQGQWYSSDSAMGH